MGSSLGSALGSVLGRSDGTGSSTSLTVSLTSATGTPSSIATTPSGVFQVTSPSSMPERTTYVASGSMIPGS